LDSGCNTIAVSQRVIRSVAPPAFSNSIMLTNITGRAISAPGYRLDLVEMGRGRLRQVKIIRLVSLDKHLGADGFLGLSYLTNYLVRLDYSGKKLTVTKQRGTRRDNQSGLPMKLKNGLPHMSFSVARRDLLPFADTGGYYELKISEAIATNLPCSPERYGSVTTPAGTGELSLEGRTRLLDNLQLGNHTIVRPYVSWSTAGPGMGPALGNGILRHFAVEFDFPEERVRFLRNDTSPIRSPNRRQLPVVLRSWKNEMFVTHVFLRPAWRKKTGWVMPCGKSGCDHGLGVRPGDEVVAVEGVSAAQVARISEILTTRLQRDKLQFVVRRNGVLLTNDVPIWEDQFSFDKAPEPPVGKKVEFAPL